MSDRVIQTSDGNQSPNIAGNSNQVLFNAKKRLANEAQTLLSIISLIPEVARKRGVSEELLDYSKDVKKKVEDRFHEYEQELKAHLADLEILYRGAYEEARRNPSLDEFQIEEACNLLRNLSIKVLAETEGNPIKALTELTRYFKEEFTAAEGDGFSEQAIEYFLYRQLIECNVFPNTTDV